MDNLTHSLAGALFGQMGLKRLSGRAMSTLIIAANIPDIDAFAAFVGAEGLAVRRGITHGPIALLLLPPVLTALVLAWHRWRPLKRGPPVRAGPLLLLAYVATLSHPALDWLNSYGIRLLEPFSNRWFYGDTLFIIDVWIWAALILGFWISRRREKRGRSDWRAPAVAAFAAIAAYIGANGLISARAETETRRITGAPNSTMVVSNPVPIAFWQRRMLLRGEDWFSSGSEYDLVRGVTFSAHIEPTRLGHPDLATSRGRADVEAFLFWSRMPIVVEQGGRAFLADQRFYDGPTEREARGRRFGSDPFTVPLDSPSEAP